MQEQTVQEELIELETITRRLLESHGLLVTIKADETLESVFRAKITSIRLPEDVYEYTIVSRKGVRGMIDRLQVVNIVSSHYAKQDDYIDLLQRDIKKLEKQYEYQKIQHFKFKELFKRIKIKALQLIEAMATTDGNKTMKKLKALQDIVNHIDD